MIDQVALTILAKIKPGARGDLDAVLGVVGADVEHNALFPFERLGNVHFARFVILDEAKDVHGNVIRPSLVFASNVDAPLDAYLDQLVTTAGEGLDRIYGHCEGYPEEGRRTPQSRLAYLQAHRIASQAFYVNTIGRTVHQVRQEARLWDALEDFVDERQRAGHEEAASLREAIRTFVRNNCNLNWALTPAARPGLGWRLKEKLRFLLTLLVLLALLPLFLLILPFFLLLLRYHEKRDAKRQGSLRLSNSPRERIAIREDKVVQNPFSAVGNIKPGWFRHLTLRVLLWTLNFACRHIYNNGDLGTVRILGLSGVNTIHFAQWIIIDEGRRVLFLSNYDGSLVSYMDDFINKVAWGLNGVFSNGVGYPETHWLLRQGANDEQAFKAFLQQRQILTQAWYSGYKQFTAVNIANNAQIRKGLGENLSEPEAARWLRRL